MQYVDLGTLKTPKRKRSKKKILKTIFLFLGFFIGIYILATLFLPSGNIIREVLNAPGNALSVLNDPLAHLKSTAGRTNILVLGIDKRKDIPYTYKGAGGKIYHNGFLSDTLLMVSIDLKSKEVAMISLPRDLWVTFGGSNELQTQSAKINSIYATGTLAQYPGGGLSLAKETVSKYLGIDIHYGARVDFEAFRRMINSVGGIDITVDNAFEDYEYPIEGKEEADCGTISVLSPEGTPVAVPTYACRYTTLRFKTGETHMDGETALGFVRSRHGTGGEGSDFARASRQQKVIVSLKNKMLSTETLLDPIKIARLIGDFGETIETDFDLAAIPGLFKLGKEFDDQKVRQAVLTIGEKELLYVPDSASYGGSYVLVPKDPTWGEVRQYVKQVLAGLAPTPSTTPTLSPTMAKKAT